MRMLWLEDRRMRNPIVALAISVLMTASVCTAAWAFEDEKIAIGDLNGLVVDEKATPARQATTLFGNIALHRPAHVYKAPTGKATDDIYGVVYAAQNKHNSFPVHPDVTTGVVYAPAPQFNSAEAARTVGTGMSIFSNVMNLVNSCSGYSGGYSSGGGYHAPVYRTPRITPRMPSCSGH